VIEQAVVARLSQPDGPDLLAGDPQALREAQERVEVLSARLDLAADQFADGAITGEQLARITGRLRPQLDEARAAARAAAPSPDLGAFVGDTDTVRRAWDAADIELRRAVINTLMTVTILPAGSGGLFDPTRIKIEWKGEHRG
jgi:hypothetical protein